LIQAMGSVPLFMQEHGNPGVATPQPGRWQTDGL
jgi:hypothetical protein